MVKKHTHIWRSNLDTPANEMECTFEGCGEKEDLANLDKRGHSYVRKTKPSKGDK